MALLIDMGEVLRASAVGFERRKRLPDIRVDLPRSKDLVVLAMLDDKLTHIFVGISQKIANFVRKLAGAAVAARFALRKNAWSVGAGAFRGIAACQRDARGEMHQGCGQVVDIVTFGGKRRRGAGVGEVSHEVRRAVHIDERSAGAPDQDARVDAERLEFSVALSYDGKEMCTTHFDMGVAGLAVLTCVDAGIGKERCRLDARERGRAVAHDCCLKRWDVYGSSHGAPYGSKLLA